LLLNLIASDDLLIGATGRLILRLAPPDFVDAADRASVDLDQELVWVD